MFIQRQKQIPWKAVPILLSAGIASVIIVLKSVDTSMTEFYGRAIGHASINGVDAPVRTTVFWSCILLFFVVFLLGLFLSGRVQEYLSGRFPGRYFALEEELLFEAGMLCLLNQVTYLYQFVSDRDTKMPPYVPAGIAVVCIHAVISVGKAYGKKKLPAETALQSALAFLMPVPVVYFMLLLLSFGKKNMTVCSLETWVLYLVLYLLMRLVVMRWMHPAAAAYALIPASFLPMAYIVGNEIQYTLTKHGIFTSPKRISFGISIGLLVAACLWYVKKRDGSALETEAVKKIENIVVPVFLVTMSVFATHMQVMEGNLDLLHNGNTTLPVQQFFQFGKLPFLDLWPHQHLPILSYLYVLLNGMNYLEINIWAGMSHAVVYTVICYFVLRQFFHARLSALFMLFTPMAVYANTYYITGLFPLLYLNTMRKKRRTIDYAIFFGLALVAFVYQSSSGKIAVIAAVVMIVLSCRSKENAVSAFKAVLITAGVPTLVYGAYVISQGENIFDRIALISALGGSDLLVGAYATLADNRTPFEIITYYGLFPLTGALTIVFVLWGQKKTEKHYAIVYLVIACLICSLRSLARHCLGEGLQMDFYALLLIVIPCIFVRRTDLKKAAVFCVMFLLMLTPYAPVGYGIADDGVKDFKFQYFKVGDERCDTLNHPAYPKNLKAVLDTVLTDDQTFFETVNAYLLYALMEREQTFFDLSTLLIQYERPQVAYLHKLEKLYEKNRVPVIITGYSDWWGAQIDGIPSELSLFKLEEWIYAHYEPWLWVDGFHLWKAKNSDIHITDNYELLGSMSLEKDDANDVYDLVCKMKEGKLVLKCGETDPHISLPLAKPIDTTAYESMELKMTYKTSVEGTLQVFYDFDGYNETDSVFVDVNETDGYQSVYVSVPETESGEIIKSIRFDPPENALFEMESVEFVKRDIVFTEKTEIQQEFQMVKLPYVWGNYDEKVKQKFPKELQKVGENVLLASQQPVKLPLDPSIDKSSGNYIYLQIDASKPGTMQLRYGGHMVNSCTFDIEPGKWDYLVRISTQYHWMNSAQTEIEVEADIPVAIKRISVLKGD